MCVTFQAWELSSRLLELGGVYEAFGAFEGALSIYQRIASSMAPSPGFENVLFRCAVVMRYMASLEVKENIIFRHAVVMQYMAHSEVDNVLVVVVNLFDQELTAG